MPGYELIGKEELDEIKEIFNNGGILFRHGFDNLRGNTYKVKEFEKKFSQEIPSNHCLAVTSGTAALRVALSALELQPDDEIITQAEKDLSKENITDQEKFLFDQKIDALKLIN